MGRKITIVGGGSFLWTPTLARDFMVEPRLAGSELWLQDIAPDRLEIVERYVTKVARAADTGWTVHTTTDRAPALDGADAVVLSITTGGLAAMRHDLEIPMRYGIAQSVGDTVGPGGYMRALRNIPVVLDVARDMARHCPDAWLVNLTNPMTTLCRAVTKHTDVRTVGVCHEYPNAVLLIRMWLGLDFGVPITSTVVGVNHLIWSLDMQIDGADGFARLREEVAARGVPPGMAVKWDLFEKTGALPMAGDRHLAEFFADYLTPETEYGAAYGVELTSIADRERWAEEGMTEWEVTGRQATLRAIESSDPPKLSPSIEDIAPIIADLYDAPGGSHIVNLPNTGQVANLPRDAVVETFATLSRAGAVADDIGALPPAVHEALAVHVANQERIVDAAVTGDRALALEVFRDDPLVRDAVAAEPLFDEMLAATREWLPQYDRLAG